MSSVSGSCARCIRFRHRGESVYKWELDKDDESLTIAFSGPLLLDDVDLVIQAALDGAGLAWVTEDRITEHLESGALTVGLRRPDALPDPDSRALGPVHPIPWFYVERFMELVQIHDHAIHSFPARSVGTLSLAMSDSILSWPAKE